MVHNDDEHALDLIEEISAFAGGPGHRAARRRGRATSSRRAAERGIYAAVARRRPGAMPERDRDRPAPPRARPTRLTEQVDRLETALERRAVIERAKGILMERHGIGDRAAFDRLRAHARSHNRTVVDVAAAVTDGHALLGAGPAGGGEPAMSRRLGAPVADLMSANLLDSRMIGVLIAVLVAALVVLAVPGARACRPSSASSPRSSC